MKILHVTTIGEKEVYSGAAREVDGGGGLGTCVFLFTRDASFMGSNELQFTCVANGLFCEKAEQLGIPCHVLHADWFTVFGRPVWLRFNRASISDLLARAQFDIIHAHNFLAVLAVGKSARKLGVPVVCTVHQDISEYVSQTGNPLLRWASRLRAGLIMQIYKRSMRYCQRFIAVSDSVKCSMVSHGFAADRIEVIRNCIEVDDPSFTKDVQDLVARYNLSERMVVGTAIRLHSSKSVHLLIEAYQALRVEFPDSFLLILGDGPERQRLEDLARSLGLADCCAFPGFLMPISNYLTLLDLYVLPSAAEGLPMAMLEAMYFGVPVVVADVGGVAEIVTDGQNGILVQPGCASQIADGIRTLLSDDGLRVSLGERARENIREQYGLARYVACYQGVYERFASRKTHF